MQDPAPGLQGMAQSTAPDPLRAAEAYQQTLVLGRVGRGGPLGQRVELGEGGAAPPRPSGAGGARQGEAARAEAQ